MPIRVLASVIQRENRLLVCQRPPHKRHGVMWEFPGGKVKGGESDFEAARRELREELGVNVTEVGPVAFSVADPGSDFLIEFLPVTIEGEPKCFEHLALEWMKEEDLLSLALAPSDRRYLLFRSQAERWGKLWGLPKLAESVTVEFSRRFRTSLGRCRPGQGRIRLAAHLQDGNGKLLEEVLCHELAHVAVYQIHGHRARPHGPEWKGLLSQAGFEPRTRFLRGEGKFPPRSEKPRARWEHRCPVCQAMRMAGRPVRNWRCAKCRNAGLPGELVITRIPAAREKAGGGEVVGGSRRKEAGGEAAAGTGRKKTGSGGPSE